MGAFADLPAAIAVLGVVGWWVSPDRAGSLPALAQLTIGVGLFYALAVVIRRRGHLRWAAILLSLGALALAALTLVGTSWAQVRFAELPALYGRLPPLLRDLTDGRAFNPRVMGMALAMLFPACLALALWAGDRTVKGVAAAGAAATALVLPLTQSVQAVLGVGAALFALAVWRTRWALALAPLAVIAAYLAAQSGFAAGLAVRALSLDDVAGIGVALRLDMWARAWDMIRDMPFTGPGLDTFPVMVWHFYPGYLLGPEPHAHNLFLQVALDLGLPGLAAFLVLMAGAGVTAVRVLHITHDRLTAAVAAGTAAGIAAYLGAGLIDTPWATKPGILLWVFLGVLAGTSRVAQAEEAVVAAPERRPVVWTGVRLALLSALVAALLLAPEARDRNAALLAAQRALLAARSGNAAPADAMRRAEAALESALPAGSPHPYARLASLRAWQAENGGATERLDAALQALREQVAREGRDPLARYAPFEAVRRRLAEEAPGDAAADLLKVYGQWTARFPRRAESYAAAAVVYEERLGDRARAVGILREGLEAGARPAGLLEAYLERLTAEE